MRHRPAIPADIKRCQELNEISVRDSGPSPLFVDSEDLIEALVHDQKVLVAEDETYGIVGMVAVVQSKPEWYLVSSLCVDPNWRRHGIASGLIEYAGECAYGTAFAIAAKAGDAFYTQQGFKPIARLWEKNAS